MWWQRSYTIAITYPFSIPFLWLLHSSCIVTENGEDAQEGCTRSHWSFSSFGLYNHFLVRTTTGSWRLVIDFSSLNNLVQQTKFKVEIVLILLLIRGSSFMSAFYMKDTYFSIPIHQAWMKYLCFILDGVVHQFFKVFSVEVLTSSKVFICMIMPVSTWLTWGIHFLCYLSYWLVITQTHLSSSPQRSACLVSLNIEEAQVEALRIVGNCKSKVHTVTRLLPSPGVILLYNWAGCILVITNGELFNAVQIFEILDCSIMGNSPWPPHQFIATHVNWKPSVN